MGRGGTCEWIVVQCLSIVGVHKCGRRFAFGAMYRAH